MATLAQAQPLNSLISPGERQVQLRILMRRMRIAEALFALDRRHNYAKVLRTPL